MGEVAPGDLLVDECERPRAVAEWNPVSVMVAAVRTLFGNPTALPADAAWPLAHPVVSSLIACATLLAIAVPLTLWRFRVRTTG